MTHHTLFIALSTGQNIANVLPILELAEPGDRVLWIESAMARRRHWGAGAIEVLQAHQGPQVRRADLGDDEAASVYATLMAHPEIAAARRYCLVLNGGTKPQMLAAQAALAAHGCALAYNLEATCELERFPAGPSGQAQRRPYTRHCIDLPDILTCGGREMVPGSGTRVWPRSSIEPVVTYGSDPQVTAGLHAAWHRYMRARAAYERVAHELSEGAEGGSPDNPEVATQVPFAEALELVPAQVLRLRRAITRGVGEAQDDGAQPVYNSAHRLGRYAQAALIHRGLPPPPALGSDFEDAVRARLLAWLDQSPRHAALVQAVWRNIRVRQRARPDTDSAEIDCALVLRNGIVLNLECKSFDATLKDLNSRLSELQRAASRPAEMAVCMPVLTGFAGHDWFADMADRAQRVRAWGYFFSLPFTLPGQPDSYLDRRGQRVQAGSFEDGLAAWLGRYLPSAPPEP